MKHKSIQIAEKVGHEFTEFCHHFDKTLEKDWKRFAADEMSFPVFCYVQYVLALEHIAKDNEKYLPKF
jgi:hypothetical protein